MTHRFKKLALWAGMLAVTAGAAYAQSSGISGLDKVEEAAGEGASWLRGGFATIIFLIAFAVAGLLAIRGRIPWGIVGGILIGALFVFGGDDLVNWLKTAFG